jgi:hypothetical protein
MVSELHGTPGHIVAEWAPGRSNPPAAQASDIPPRRLAKLYGLDRRRRRLIGWSVIGGFVALGIIWAVTVKDSNALGVCLVLAFLPWWLTFWGTRPVMRTSERGLIVGQVIPWDQVERVALLQDGDGHPRVVVQAYAGSVVIDRVIERYSAQKRFTDFVHSVDQFHQSRQMAGPSAAEASLNRGTGAGDSARLAKADRRAHARTRTELHRGTGVQLDRAGSAATTHWAPDPTGTHELRLIREGLWTPMVVTAGLPSSDPALSGPAAFDWIVPATAPTQKAASEWFLSGTYVFRSTWKNPFIVPKPIWYSTVWKDNRPIFLIEDNGRLFTAFDSWKSYPAAHRSRTRIRSHFRGNGRSIRATRKGAVIDSATGTSIASTYSVANQRPDTSTGDHTVVVTVPNAIPMPLGVLILSYATRRQPFFIVEGGGG